MNSVWIKKIQFYYSPVRGFIKEYQERDILNLSAALSFFALLSLIPILMIVVSIAGHYLVSSDVMVAKVDQFLGGMFPALRDIVMGNLHGLVKKKKMFGGVGITFLFGAAHYFFSNLEKSINRLLGSVKKRHFLVTRLLFLVWIAGIIVLLLSPTVIANLSSKTEIFGVKNLAHFRFPVQLLFFVTSFVMFLFMILILPTKRVKFKNALWGALVFSILLRVAQFIFRLYTTYAMDRYNVVYGSLTAMILGMFWIFYFSHVLLITVLLVARLERHSRRFHDPRPAKESA